MMLRLVRRHFTDRASEGELFVDGAHECWTIEDRSRELDKEMGVAEIQRCKVNGQTAIPTGLYALELYDSPKHGPETLQLVGVPAFSNIQIHAANRAEELLGCIAPGTDPTTPSDDFIGGSRAALSALRVKVLPSLRAGEHVYIAVEEERN